VGTREEIPENEPAGSGATRRPANCGYYLRKERDLIHRHVETIDLDLDDTARWRLRIDFELPTHPESYWTPQAKDDGEQTEAIFLFPIVFLEKSDVRTGFKVRQEDGAELTIPTREECNEISAQAAVQAAEALLAELDPPRPFLRTADLERIFRLIARWKPVDSAMVLEELQRQLSLDDPGDEPDSGKGEGEKKSKNDPVAKLGRAWKREGLVDVLKMLVEHTLVWLPIRGRPGERRTIVLTQEKVLVRRSFVRWVVTDLRQTKYFGPQRWRKRRREKARARPALELGDKRYGRRAYRISFSALAERIGRPLAWTPYEFQLPTIYTKRCRSYHFELTCPPGRTPRDLRVAKGTPLAESSEGRSHDHDEHTTGQTTLTSRRARHDRPGNDLAADLWFRVSVGTGDNAFPLLWLLAGMVTAVMLWVFAGDNPLLGTSQAEIGAAILLAVPALIAALAFGGSEVPVSRLIGGAQMLLLIAGLSAVVAAAVVGGARPFELERDWIWSVCAMTATVATFPLATAWLLSNPFVWTQMKRLRSRRRQKEALWIVVVLTLVGIDAVVAMGDASLSDGVVAVYLLAVGVCATVLANNRAAMPIVENRKYVAFSFLIVAIVCLALACIELRAAIDEGPGPQLGVELGAFVLALASLGAGNALSKLTQLKWIGPRGGEVHVSPQVGRALLAKERVRELAILREREKQSGLAG
jgi:hypothetical protein